MMGPRGQFILSVLWLEEVDESFWPVLGLVAYLGMKDSMDI